MTKAGGLILYHGTRADLAAGDLVSPGHASNYEAGRTASHVYFAALLEPAIWGAELAAGDGPGRVYIVDPLGDYHDDPNVTDKRFAGNPTRSFRSTQPLRVVGEVLGWVGHSADQVQAMKDGIASLKAAGNMVIYD